MGDFCGAADLSAHPGGNLGSNAAKQTLPRSAQGHLLPSADPCALDGQWLPQLGFCCSACGGSLAQRRSHGVTLEPAFDVRPEPTAPTAGAFRRKGSREDPAVESASMPTRDALHVVGVEDLVNPI
jgi:hypothetical protein